MVGLVILWTLAVLGGVAAYWWMPESRSNDDGHLPRWRTIAASAIFVGVAGTAVLGRVDPTLHVCEASVVVEVAEDATTQETTQVCGPLLDATLIALLMVPVLALIAPTVSEFTIAGLFSAKMRQVAAEEAERKTSSLLITLDFGRDFQDALRDSQTPEVLKKLPDE